MDWSWLGLGGVGEATGEPEREAAGEEPERCGGVEDEGEEVQGAAFEFAGPNRDAAGAAEQPGAEGERERVMGLRLGDE